MIGLTQSMREDIAAVFDRERAEGCGTARSRNECVEIDHPFVPCSALLCSGFGLAWRHFRFRWGKG